MHLMLSLHSACSNIQLRSCGFSSFIPLVAVAYESQCSAAAVTRCMTASMCSHCGQAVARESPLITLDSGFPTQMRLACATLSLDKSDLTRPAVRLRLEASLGVLEPAKLLHRAPRSVRPELALRRCAAIAAARQIRRDLCDNQSDHTNQPSSVPSLSSRKRIRARNVCCGAVHPDTMHCDVLCWQLVACYGRVGVACVTNTTALACVECVRDRREPQCACVHACTMQACIRAH